MDFQNDYSLEDDFDSSLHLHKDDTILTESDLRERQEDVIARVSSSLSIPRVSASILLHHYQWNPEKACDMFCDDDEMVRKTIGLSEKPIVAVDLSGLVGCSGEDFCCGMCSQLCPRDATDSASCGHTFCRECWGNYLSCSINSGPECLALRCPYLSCSVAIGDDMIKKLACDQDKERYFRFLLKSFIENACLKKERDFIAGALTGVFMDMGVNYEFDLSFCWNCVEECHRPVDCDTAVKWMWKERADFENFTWKIANTNPCSGCKRLIEKYDNNNEGIGNVVTWVQPCYSQFCLKCLGQGTRIHHSCNKKEGARRAIRLWNERAKNAKSSLDRYGEQWANNQVSWQKALEDLREVQTVHIPKLSEELAYFSFDFVEDAWKQIIGCRRKLNWICVYICCCLPEHEIAKRNFMEFLLQEAETMLGRLYQCAKNDLTEVAQASTDQFVQFSQFHFKLLSLTNVVRKYFNNLVRRTEEGLSDVQKSKI